MIVFFSTKLRILSLVIYTAILVRAFAAAPERTITKEMALHAITLFRTDPTPENGRTAGGTNFRFRREEPERGREHNKEGCLVSDESQDSIAGAKHADCCVLCW